MAQSLVTQVANPDDLELGTSGVYVEEKKPDPPKRSFWARCCACLPCCAPSEAPDEPPAPPAPGPPRVPDAVDDSAPRPGALLPPMSAQDEGKKCLVLDLDETLVHSSFKPVPDADFVISIELEGELHHVYVLKRPGVDDFLRAVAEKYEVVVFTASLAKYADPLLDQLDTSRVISARLFRDACVQHYGNYVKDLSHLGRELPSTLIIDNSPYSYIFQPDNAIPISSWFNDQSDRQLFELLPLLDELAQVDDVRTVLERKTISQPTERPAWHS